MNWRRPFILPIVCGALSSCSYDYDLKAVVQNGHLAFIVASTSPHDPSCVRQVEVLSEDREKAEAAPGDDATRIGYGTFWFESVTYDDDCANRFPLEYGSKLKGKPLGERGIVAAKPLLREVVYQVATTTGATGYGGGRFVIHVDGRVENLPNR